MKQLLQKILLITILAVPLGMFGQVQDLIFSEYGEGSSNNKYLELYNGTGQVLDLSNYAIWKITNDGVWFEREFVLGGALADGSTYLIVNENADSLLLARRDTIGPVGVDFALFNGNEAFAIVKITGPNPEDKVIIDVIGMESGTVSPSNWDVAGVVGAGAEHTWVRKATVCQPQSDWATSAGTNATDSEWIVYDQNYWDDAGMHTTNCGTQANDVTLDLFFSEYGEGSANNKYLELYNGTGSAIDLSQYTIWKITNDGNWYEREFVLEGTLANDDTYMIVHASAGATLLMQSDTSGPTDFVFPLFNGNEAFALVKITGPDTLLDRQILDVIGVESGATAPANWDVAGVIGAGAEHTWVRKPTVCGPNNDWASSAGTNTEDSEWTVYDADYWDDAGQHTFTLPAAPTFVGAPVDMSVRCDMIPSMFDAIEANFVAASGQVLTTMVTPEVLGSADMCGGQISVVYTFTDPCNRTITHIQTITVNPSPVAFFVNPPSDIEVDYANIPAPMALEVTNDGAIAGCPLNTTVMPVIIDNSSKCGGTVVYTWAFTDDCGRTISHSQKITVQGEGGKATELYFSEYGEGSSNNKYLEIYNGTPSAVDLSTYTIWKITNEGNWFEAEFRMEGTLGSCATYLIVNQSADATLAALRDTTGPTTPNFALFNGNEAFALVKVTGPDSLDRVILDVIGEESGTTSPGNWDVAGVVGAGAEHTWVRKPSICGPNNNWAASAGTNAEDSEWIVYDADYWDDAGQHTDECTGIVTNYDNATDIFFSEYGEGSNNNKYLEIFNGTGADVDLSNYTIWKIINDGNWFEREFEMEGTLGNNSTYLIVNQDADEFLSVLRDTTGPTTPIFTLFNGNEAFAIVKKTGPNPEDRVILDVIGKESGADVPANWDVAGVVEAGAEHTWIRKPTVCGPNSDWALSAGNNAENSEWIVFDADFWDNAGKHNYQCVMMGNPTANVTFKVDMNLTTVSPNGVHIAGSFQNWDPGATVMTDADSDGVYEITIELPISMEYEYKFVNGNAWGMEESVPSACAKNGNRFIAVGASALVLDPVCFSSCGNCQGVYPVTFRVDMSKETVSSKGVHIAGSFQNWDPSTTTMTDADGDNIYEVTLDLNGGNTYQYKIVNGDAWGDDESVPAECALDNNRFLTVENAAIVTDAFCFGSCTSCETSTIDQELDKTLTINPNPNNGRANLNFYQNQGKLITVKCFNVIGNLVSSNQIQTFNGNNNIELNFNDKGLFFVVLETANGIATRKVVVIE